MNTTTAVHKKRTNSSLKTDSPTKCQCVPDTPVETVTVEQKRLYAGASRRLSLLRQHCLECAGGASKLVADCPGEFQFIGRCPLWAWRFGVTSTTAIRHGRIPAECEFSVSLAKSIRQYCLQCCNGSMQEVRLCPSTDCRLWEWRFGVRPQTAALRTHEAVTRGGSRTSIGKVEEAVVAADGIYMFIDKL